MTLRHVLLLLLFILCSIYFVHLWTTYLLTLSDPPSSLCLSLSRFRKMSLLNLTTRSCLSSTTRSVDRVCVCVWEDIYVSTLMSHWMSLCFSVYHPLFLSSQLADTAWQNPFACLSSSYFVSSVWLTLTFLVCMCVCVVSMCLFCVLLFSEHSTFSSLSSSLKLCKASWIPWLDARCSLYDHTHTCTHTHTHTVSVFADSCASCLSLSKSIPALSY